MAAGRTSMRVSRIETALKEERRTVAEREHRSIAHSPPRSVSLPFAG